jgi:hypothetical protein
MLQDFNMFNRFPAEGYKGVLIYFVCEYLSGPQDEPGTVSSMEFDFLCGDGQFYDKPFATVLSPEFGGSGFPGTTFEGWLYQGCRISNNPDLLVWKESWLSSTGKGIYFALQ